MVMSSNIWETALQEYNAPQQPNQLSMPSATPPSNKSSNDPAALVYSPFEVAKKMYTGEEPEGYLENAVRNINRTGSRMVETVLGLPGDVEKFAKNVPSSFGMLGTALEKFIGRDKWNSLTGGGPQGSQMFPGQQDLQKISETLTKGGTSPQGKGEELSDEVVKTFTSLMVPGGGTNTVVGNATRLAPINAQMLKMGRNLGAAIAAESAREGIKLYGGSPGAQEFGKMSTLMMLGMTLPRLTRETNPEAYLEALYQGRDARIPQGTMVTPTGLAHGLQNFINNRLRFGGPTAEKTHVLGEAQAFLDRINNRAIPMDELLQMYRDINRNRSNVMMAPIDKTGVRTARGYYGEMASLFNNSIEGYLGSISPEALQFHRQANSGWASLSQSQRASEFLMDKINNVPLKTGVATLFGGGILYNPSAAATSLGLAGLGAGGIKGVEMAYRFMTNPTLRHYYNDVIMHAMRENGPQAVRALKKLDDFYAKELANPKSNVNQPIPSKERINRSPQ